MNDRLIKDNQPLQYQQADIFYNLENHPQVPLPFDPQYNNLAINDLIKKEQLIKPL